MNNSQNVAQPISGVGIGLRSKHIGYVLDHRPPIPWFELLADNWLTPGGIVPDQLDAVSEQYPVALHGVGLSLGGVDPLDLGYLSQIQRLMQRSGALWYSEHACFTRHAGAEFHDLCPLPGTEEAVYHLSQRISQVQDFLGERLLLENVSSYVQYQDSPLSEAEFLAAVAECADCCLLVDINNFYVNQINHGADALQEMEKLPAHRVRELHLAGAEMRDGFLIDTHSRPVSDEVWALYQKALGLWGPVATLIEWDNDLPDWPVLEQEQQKASQYLTLHMSAHTSSGGM
jgi:uncharacterized protein (UPF0276 family)